MTHIYVRRRSSYKGTGRTPTPNMVRPMDLRAQAGRLRQKRDRRLAVVRVPTKHSQMT